MCVIYSLFVLIEKLALQGALRPYFLVYNKTFRKKKCKPIIYQNSLQRCAQNTVKHLRLGFCENS